MLQLVQPGSHDEKAVDQQRHSDKEPDRNHLSLLLSEINIQCEENYDDDARPKQRLLIDGHVSD